MVCEVVVVVVDVVVVGEIWLVYLLGVDVGRNCFFVFFLGGGIMRIEERGERRE